MLYGRGHGGEPSKRARGDWKASGPPKGEEEAGEPAAESRYKRLESQSRKAANESKLLDSGVPELLAAGCRISY